jgi:tRNA (guanine-N7-)-methyltransferase
MNTTLATAVYQPRDWLGGLDWREVFATAGPVEVDVGAGKGSFLLWSAQQRPGANFLGVERKRFRLRRLDARILRLGLSNVRLICVEAGYLVERLIPDESVGAYHVKFPDPWPKRRHHRRRLFTAGFAGGLHRTLAAGGAVNIATDHAEYFRQIARVMRQCAGFVQAVPEELPDAARTDVERRLLAAGAPVYRCRFVKRDG